MGVLYDPNNTINPVNGLLPAPVYFQNNSIWHVNTPQVAPLPANDERVNQLRELQQQIQEKE